MMIYYFVLNINMINIIHHCPKNKIPEMILRGKNKITPEEYLALEKISEIRNEYFDGEIFAIAGGKP